MELELNDLILVNLVKSDNYLRKVIPFLKPDYFRRSHKTVYEIIEAYIKTTMWRRPTQRCMSSWTRSKTKSLQM